MLKNILADYSGTLVMSRNGFDARRGFRSVFRYVCPEADDADIESMADFAVDAEVEFQRLRDLTVLEFSFLSLLRSDLGCLSLRTTASMELLESIYYRDVISYVAADGAVQFFREAKKSGLRLGVVSNTTHSGALVEDQLEQCGFGGIFAAVVSSADYGIRKQHHLLYDIGLSLISCAKENVVFVGDNELFDIETAGDAGISSVLYNGKVEATGNSTEACFSFDSWMDITHKDFMKLLPADS